MKTLQTMMCGGSCSLLWHHHEVISLTQTTSNTDTNLERFIGQYVSVGSTRCRGRGLGFEERDGGLEG